jgi:nucleoside-diphosphate-sugar epimerase
MTRSIVFGGAGFLGSHLVDALTRRGESVIVIDDLSTGRLGNLERAISSGRVTFVYVDIPIDADLLRTIVRTSGLRDVDFLYYFVPPVDAEPDGGLRTRALIDIAIEQRARLIVSWTVDADRDDRAGALAGKTVAAAMRERGLDARLVRVSHCYGPRAQNGDPVIGALLEAAIAHRPMPIEGSGHQVRPITYVADAIDQIVAVACRTQTTLEPIDVVGSDKRSVIEIASALARAVGMELDVAYVPGDHAPQRRRELRNSGDFGAWPATSLEAGLRNTYVWFAKETRLFV